MGTPGAIVRDATTGAIIRDATTGAIKRFDADGNCAECCGGPPPCENCPTTDQYTVTLHSDIAITPCVSAFLMFYLRGSLSFLTKTVTLTRNVAPPTGCNYASQSLCRYMYVEAAEDNFQLAAWLSALDPCGDSADEGIVKKCVIWFIDFDGSGNIRLTIGANFSNGFSDNFVELFVALVPLGSGGTDCRDVTTDATNATSNYMIDNSTPATATIVPV